MARSRTWIRLSIGASLRAADAVAARLSSPVRCEISGMMVAEYYRLTRDSAEVKRLYEQLSRFDGAKYWLVCMNAAQGKETNWDRLAESGNTMDRLTALALSDLTISPDIEDEQDIEALLLVGMYLARGKLDEAEKIARREHGKTDLEQKFGATAAWHDSSISNGNRSKIRARNGSLDVAPILARSASKWVFVESPRQKVAAAILNAADSLDSAFS